MANTRKIFRDNLFFYLSKSGEQQTDICNLLGVSSSTVSSWFSAEKMPRVEKIEALAEHFGVSVSDLLSPRNTKTSIPILGRVQAGVPTTAVQDVMDYIDIPSQMATQGEHFALEVKGNSMTPDFQEGDIVIVRRQPSVDDGDIAVFSVEGDDATIKEFKRAKNGIILLPHNTEDFSPMIYTEQDIVSLPVLVLGKVIELRRSYV